MTDLLAVYLSRVKAILDQSPETKLRHVRDSAYWGMPDGTPIVAGMKPVKKPTMPRIVPNRPRSVGDDGTTVRTAPPFDPVRSPDTLPAEVLNKPDIITFGEEEITRGKDSIWNHLVPDGEGGYKLTPERQDFYRRLIEPMVAGKPKQDHPIWTVLGGGGGSGKGFLQKKHPELFTDEDVTVKIDPDELKMVIHKADPEYDFLTKDDRAGFLHEESSVMAKMAQEVGFAKQAHVLLDGTGNSSLTKLTRKLDEGRKAGYTVNGVYVSVPTQLAWARNVKRGKTSNERAVVAPWAVSSAHQKVSQITPNAHRLYDSFEVFDMAGEGDPVLIARSAGGSDLEVLDEDQYQGFLSKGTTWSADELMSIEVPAAYLAAPSDVRERDYLPEWFFDYAARPGTKAVLFKAAEADIDDDLARTLMKNALLGYAFEDAGVPDTAVHRAAYAEIVNSVAQVRALCPDAEVIIPGEIPDPQRFGYAVSLFDDGFIDSF